MRRPRVAVILAATLIALIIASGAVLFRDTVLRPHTVTAYFTSAAGIYAGDEVRVAGVRVGTISAIDPVGANVRFTLKVDRSVEIPAAANAVVVAQSLIAARYVQLAPALTDGGPVMADGAVIPIERTAVPVEWDEVKTQLTRLATQLGPKSVADETSVARFIDSAANALDGNGEKLRNTLTQISALARTLAAGSGDIVGTLKNLQVFVTALRDSSAQIVQFEDRFATLTSVLDNSRSDIDSALTQLSVALVQVQRFVANNRDKTTEQVQRLANVTQNLVDHRMDLENLLHAEPNAISNVNGIYNPNTGAIVGSFVLNNFSNPVALICSEIGAVENATAPETAKLCDQYLGPVLKQLNFNYLPFPFNPYLTPSPSPDKVIYSDPKLAPAGTGPAPTPRDDPPSVSAYAGAGDVAPPPGWAQPSGPNGILAPDGLPAAPSPALYPGAPIPVTPSASPADRLPGVLLPAEVPPPLPDESQLAPGPTP
jgi:phospholipid/cholesterol/gamma-HCH transport system substrate-binding protein